MNQLETAVDRVVDVQKQSTKPLAVILAGHNGSGKSTMWYQRLAEVLRIPLVNADRMMLSILPEASEQVPLPEWAVALRDKDTSWMRVAQKGVQAFVAQALANSVPFAMETVFSHWVEHADGSTESKIDQIRQMQAAGYFVILFFVGLTNEQLSIGRVQTRVRQGGHAVSPDKLLSRFPRTQKAIAAALNVVDAAILVDNSRQIEKAFTVCRVQIGPERVYDCRTDAPIATPLTITNWLDKVAPDLA